MDRGCEARGLAPSALGSHRRAFVGGSSAPASASWGEAGLEAVPALGAVRSSSRRVSSGCFVFRAFQVQATQST